MGLWGGRGIVVWQLREDDNAALESETARGGEREGRGDLIGCIDGSQASEGTGWCSVRGNGTRPGGTNLDGKPDGDGGPPLRLPGTRRSGLGCAGRWARGLWFGRYGASRWSICAVFLSFLLTSDDLFCLWRSTKLSSAVTALTSREIGYSVGTGTEQGFADDLGIPCAFAVWSR
jgi:hypothetical protein